MALTVCDDLHPRPCGPMGLQGPSDCGLYPHCGPSVSFTVPVKPHLEPSSTIFQGYLTKLLLSFGSMMGHDKNNVPGHKLPRCQGD